MNLIISRKIYILITLINVLIFTILGGLFCRYLVIEKMERYDFLHMIKNNIDSIVGKDNNRNYFIYMILFLHTLYSIIIFISLTFTPYIDIYIVNVAIAIFVVYTNLEFKGCLLRKYEKMVFRIVIIMILVNYFHIYFLDYFQKYLIMNLILMIKCYL